MKDIIAILVVSFIAIFLWKNTGFEIATLAILSMILVEIAKLKERI